MERVRRRGIGWVVVVVACMLVDVCGAEARITIRSRATLDELRFHAQYMDERFDPADDFRLSIWTCASGAMPSYVAGADPAIVCGDEGTPAGLAYAVDVAGGTCVDHGQSCYVRTPESAIRTSGGVRYFKVQYANRGSGNKIWLETLGDLSAADQPNMLLLIAVDGRPLAMLEGTFVARGARVFSAEF